MRTVRWLLGTVGVLSLAAGGRMLLDQPAPAGVVRWLVGAVVLHDVVLVPLVLAVGLLVRRLGGHGVRGVVRGGLVVAGCVTLAALPPLLRPGQPANPTVLPLDYGRNVLLLVTVTGMVTLALAVGARSRGRRCAPCRATALSGDRPVGRPPAQVLRSD